MPTLIAPKIPMLHDERTRNKFVRFFREAIPLEICHDPKSFMLLSERLMDNILS